MRIISRFVCCVILVVSTGSIPAQETLVKKGEEIFLAKCEYCHGPGLQKGGTMMLQHRYQGTVPAALSERTNLTPEYIKTVVRTFTKGMAPYRVTEITDDELDALVVYLMRNNND